MTYTRNFSIIAHIDHGKSTLADRLIEACGVLDERKKIDQMLDSMDLERERGITIKAQTATLLYRASDQQTYQFNLIDTPGHVDFSYEVSRSLAACEGALLVVDATQGVEAQTVANYYTAIRAGVEIIPVLNKIDLPSSDIERVRSEIEDVLGLDAQDAILCSAKTGVGVASILEALVTGVPAPRGDPHAPLRALIIDSWFDNYVGVVMLVRVFDGQLATAQRIQLMSTGESYPIEKLGIFTPQPRVCDVLTSGAVGYVVAGIRLVAAARVGDTITEEKRPAEEAWPGFQAVKPQVFAGLYPVDTTQYAVLREALDKLKLNDASLCYEPETSDALGHGFRCGFLGLLHMDIVQQRLERSFHMSLIVTTPSVVYEVLLQDGRVLYVENPAKLPDATALQEIREPIITCRLFLPPDCVGAVMGLCLQKRGEQNNMQYHSHQVMMSYDMPLSEVVVDFLDRLKSLSRGYASFEYEFKMYRAADVVKLDVLINGDCVDAFSTIVHRAYSQRRGRDIVEKLRSSIPRQLFDVAIQAAVGARIVARETVKALRKNVLAKCYGGDITRKRKLLEKQKEGKKRMKKIGSVDIPQEAFLAIVRDDR